MAKNNDLLVIKHNDVVEATYQLSLNAQRLLLLAITRIKPKVPLGVQRVHTISSHDFMDMYSIDQKNVYAQLKDGADGLFEEEIQTYDGENKDRIRWVSKATYNEKRGSVTVSFTDEIKPYLTFLSEGKYVKYKLISLAGAKSQYAYRLYEILKVWRTKNERFIYIDDLRKWLKLQDKYERYYNFKKRVLEPAIKDINDNTDLEVDWEEVKKGRQVVKLNFIFASEKQVSMFK